MTKQDKIQLFEQNQVRTVWGDDNEKWYFSVIYVVRMLTNSVDPTAYWRKLKLRLKVLLRTTTKLMLYNSSSKEELQILR